MDVRVAELADAEPIASIYNREVLESTATFDLEPRSIADQRRWLLERSGAHVVLVADDESSGVIAFASLSAYKSRPAYSTTVESSVYVDVDSRGKGVAKVLMTELISRARMHGFHAMIARIADSQESSLRLHQSMGFELVGIEREVGRKFGRWLDVSVMQVML